MAHRRKLDFTRFARGFVLLAILATGLASRVNAARDVVPGIATDRQIPGKPYELLGKRIVFTNWYYVDPGDLDWINAEGKSVYVHGNEHPDAAIFVGKRTPHGIRLRAHKPEVRGPINNMPHRTIIHDGDRYKAWTDNEYFESTDGMAWTKVANLKMDAGFTDGIVFAFIDPNGPPEQRYKSVWATDNMTSASFEKFRQRRPDGWEPRALLHYQETGRVSAVFGGYSADGLNWTSTPEPIVVEYADTLNTAYFDQVLRRYVLFTRQWSVGPRSSRFESDIRNSWTDVGRRAIGRSESADFMNFPPSETIIEPTPDMAPSEVLYTNCYTHVPGAPDNHLLFPTIWNASVNDTTRLAMLSSHDGRVWHWVPGGDILETGVHGAWNGGCIWGIPNLIELPDKSWALPYSAHNVPHKYPRGQRVGGVGYAIWPKGRMASLDADDEGEFHLIPVIAAGSKLRVNAVTTRAGRITIEVVGVEHHALADCDLISGDKAWTPVTWKGQDTLGVEPGAAITLRVRMNQAQLFGLDFE